MMQRIEAEQSARRRARKTGRTWYVVWEPSLMGHDSGPYHIADDEDMDTFYCGQDNNITLACEPN